MKSTDEILERAECAKDSKARRVSNVAPDTVANVTAETLESGIELEALEALNVPVFRYATQITIHGRLPDFNERARVGGYRAVFRNQNGSVGVRYCAIDGKKKAQIAAVAQVAPRGAWHVSACSSAFEIVAMVSPRLEAAERIAEAKRLFAIIPADKFFGAAYYARGLYGEIYVCAQIGALYAENLWPICAAFFGMASPLEFAVAKSAADAETARADAIRDARNEREAAEAEARRAAIRADLLAGLAPIASVPDNCTVLIDGKYNVLTVRMEKERGRLFYTITHRDGASSCDRKRKLATVGHPPRAGFPWPKSLESGKVYPAPALFSPGA